AGPPVDDAMSGSRARQIRPLFTLYLPVMTYVLIALCPLYFMLDTSFKKNAELYDPSSIPFLIQRGVTFGHYQLLSNETLFWSWFVNSLIVSVAATVISVVIGILAAYPLARMRFLGGDSFGMAIFITYLVPPSLLFLTLRILLPVAVPGVICAALFAFTLSWNEFLYALVFVSPAELKTMTVGVFSELIRGDIYYWGGLMAGACIGSLPIVVAYVFFLDYY